MLMLMSLLSSCYISVREVGFDDVLWEVDRELSDNGEFYIFTVRLNSQRKDIKGLVLGIHFYNETGKHIGMTYIKAGDVDYGRVYKFQFDINSEINMTLEEQETAKVHVQLLAGNIVL